MTKKIYTGAGILIIEKEYANSRHVGPAVILFRNVYNNRYNDLGGTHDINIDHNIKNTAEREATEESMALFDLKLNKNSLSIDIQHTKDTYYKSYIFGINSGCLRTKYYNNNYYVVNTVIQNHVWRETDRIARFYISDIYDCGILYEFGHFKCIDTSGHTKIIDNRACKILRSIFSKKIYKDITFVKLYKNFNNIKKFKKEHNLKKYDFVTLTNKK